MNGFGGLSVGAELYVIWVTLVFIFIVVLLHFLVNLHR